MLIYFVFGFWTWIVDGAVGGGGVAWIIGGKLKPPGVGILIGPIGKVDIAFGVALLSKS